MPWRSAGPVRAEASNPRNTRWEVSERVMSIAGGEARPVERRETVLRIGDYTDPDLDPYCELNCGDLTYQT